MKYNDPADVPPTWKVGDVILDRYEVKQVFTSGGMGLVYRVHHRDWDMELAAKSPRPEFFQSQQQIETFEREAETWVSLGLHPHIVSCYYVRRLGGIPRIFAEYVEGGTLAEWIRTKQLYQSGKEKGLERVIDVAIQFAWGLHYAHENGLVHQDVKPGNVLLSLDGTAKVADFGLANARRASAESTTVAPHPGQSILVPGSGFMTPEYASPEQLRGEHLSRKTDIWSWAVSLLEMLLGELTWTSGIAAPAALEELDNHHFDEKLVAVLNSCFGAQGHTRITSFEPALEALMCYYTLRFGSYHRQAPNAADLSSDETNNRAVSMADLGRNEDALLTLEKALTVDPAHVLATYNYALLNRRLGYKTDAFGRDALNGLLQRDPSNLTAMAAIALLCMERGIFFRTQRFYQQLRLEGGPVAPYLTEVEALLKGISESALCPPRVVQLCDSDIRYLRVSPDGTHLIVTDSAGNLTSYTFETGARCISLSTQYQFLTWADNKALLEHADHVFSWNLQERPELLQPFRMEIPENDHLAVSSSGLRCFVALGETLTMFDTSSGDVLWEHELDDMAIDNEYASVEYEILNLAFSPAGDYVAVATNRDVVSMEVFDAEDGYQVAYQHHRGELLHFSADFILTTDSCNIEHPLVTWGFLRSSPVDGLPSARERARDHVTVKGLHDIMRGSRLGLASKPASNIAVLTPDRCIQILRVPQLEEAATLRWSELIEGGKVNGEPVCLGSDSRTWCVATSKGEIVSFRWNEPRRAPFLIAKPASHGRLSERWRTQTNLLEEAKRHFDAGAFAEALAETSAAVVIRGGRNGEAVELHDKITSLGRKGIITALRLAFDIERTILGGQFQWIDVTSDGRCGLVERTHFSRNTNCAGDHYRLVHLPDGRMESVPDIEIARHLIRRVSPQKDCIISATPSGFIVTPLGSANGCARPFSAPPIVADASKHPGDDRSPSYYTSDVQFALGGEIIVAADLASEWCSDKGRCDEWHLFARNTRRLTRIHTNSSHVRIMPDGFHAYTATPQAIWLLQWPFQKASSYGYPDGVFGAWYSNGVERREIRLDAIAFSSDRSKLFFADSKGGLYVRNLEDSYAGWQKSNAHAETIFRCFAGADPRFLITVAADGLKIWNTEDMAVVFSRDDLDPTWVSDDFRFLVEQKKGTVWELEWEYSFTTPEGIEESALPHLEGFLRCRQALAEARGIELSWDHDACETIARELARCGCGLLSAERVNSLATTEFPYLLRPRIDPTT